MLLLAQSSPTNRHVIATSLTTPTKLLHMSEKNICVACERYTSLY